MKNPLSNLKGSLNSLIFKQSNTEETNEESLDTNEETTTDDGQKSKELTPEQQAKQREHQQAIEEAKRFAQGLLSVQDIIAPSGIEIDFNELRIGSTFYRTYFIAGYPREVGPNWLSPIVNFPHALDISMFYYPIDARSVLKNLRRKITEMQTELNIEYKEGRILDPEVQLSLQDAKSLQDDLVTERERFFQFALYITIPHEDLKQLRLIGKQLESILGGILLVGRKATLQMEDGFQSTLPIHSDTLKVYRNMDTTSIATTFPFTSSSLTSDEGVMYGINEHNGSLIIFDRFQMENANSVIFGKSGSGKSYMIKLEAIRSLLLGAEVLIIDPENEYRTLCEVIGGEYITYDFNSESRINPFDLSQIYEEGEDQLELKVLVLDSLIKVMMGEISANEEAIMDRALLEAYRMKGITADPNSQKRESPLMEDLYKVLRGMEDPAAGKLANQLEKYVVGSARGLFDQHTNIDIKNTFTVFGIRDLEDSVRPMAMFLILDYIWTRIRRDRRRRILFVDEAWIMMKHPDSANFMHSIAKRARKYYLGLSTISQDIEDFLNSDKGLSIVNNSSIQILMKQSTNAIDKLAEVFFLSEGEQNLLLSANVGEGLFFAGESHVAMQVVASQGEHNLITTNPQELEVLERQKQLEVNEQSKLSRVRERGTGAELGEFEEDITQSDEIGDEGTQTPQLAVERSAVDLKEKTSKTPESKDETPQQDQVDQSNNQTESSSQPQSEQSPQTPSDTEGQTEQPEKQQNQQEPVLKQSNQNKENQQAASPQKTQDSPTPSGQNSPNQNNMSQPPNNNGEQNQQQNQSQPTSKQEQTNKQDGSDVKAVPPIEHYSDQTINKARNKSENSNNGDNNKNNQ